MFLCALGPRQRWYLLREGSDGFHYHFFSQLLPTINKLAHSGETSGEKVR